MAHRHTHERRTTEMTTEKTHNDATWGDGRTRRLLATPVTLGMSVALAGLMGAALPTGAIAEQTGSGMTAVTVILKDDQGDDPNDPGNHDGPSGPDDPNNPDNPSGGGGTGGGTGDDSGGTGGESGDDSGSGSGTGTGGTESSGDGSGTGGGSGNAGGSGSGRGGSSSSKNPTAGNINTSAYVSRGTTPAKPAAGLKSLMQTGVGTVVSPAGLLAVASASLIAFAMLRDKDEDDDRQATTAARAVA